MIDLYDSGAKIGTLVDGEKLLREFAAQQKEVELRDEAGHLIGRFIPAEPVCPWNPNLTQEVLERMSAQGGGSTLAAFWKHMGVE